VDEGDLISYNGIVDIADVGYNKQKEVTQFKM